MRYLLALLLLFVLTACQTGQETTVEDKAVAEDSSVDNEGPNDVAAPTGETLPEDPTQNKVPDATHGAEVYARVCVTCHGKSGDGKGMEMKLFGFDAPASEWTNGPSVDGILKTLDEGVHESSMKPFPEYSEGDRRAVALYVLELRERLLSDESSLPSMEK